MADVKSTWEAETLPLVRELAERKFAKRPDRDEWVCDAIRISWEFAQTAGPNAVPQSIAFYALERVQSTRRFSESKRSIDGPYLVHREIRREHLNLDDCLIREGDNPAEIAAFRLDFIAWFDTLNVKQRQILECLAQGDRTHEVAETFQCTPGRVSQVRRELMASYEAFG